MTLGPTTTQGGNRLSPVNCPVCGQTLESTGRVPTHTIGPKYCRGSGGPSEADLAEFVRGIYPPNAALIVTAVRGGIKATRKSLCECGQGKNPKKNSCGDCGKRKRSEGLKRFMQSKVGSYTPQARNPIAELAS